ncbi:hypothetical protein JQK87_25300 [Streptomyces sp. G44]|uniref:hypothetical protein n=1 Tax=Streptomyces sp. G44 TaxID=2807632 RepID=UPI00195F3B9A|nr:hypothetical protein [Streptomyces sp. G44]MBM7171660.1 hypothetical protein [Streptomyces sp. G44]
MQHSPPQRIPANALRPPGRHWYATAATIAAVLTVLGVALGAYRFSEAIDAVDTGRQFADGDTVTVRLAPEDEKALWIKERGPSADQTCDISGPGDPALTAPGIDVYLTRDAAWNPLHTIHVPQAGDYRITCTSRGPSRYAIGNPGGLVALGGWLLLSILLPTLGIITGTAMALTTAIRRRSHHKRLLTEGLGSGVGNATSPGPGPGSGSASGAARRQEAVPHGSGGASRR